MNLSQKWPHGLGKDIASFRNRSKSAVRSALYFHGILAGKALNTIFITLKVDPSYCPSGTPLKGQMGLLTKDNIDPSSWHIVSSSWVNSVLKLPNGTLTCNNYFLFWHYKNLWTLFFKSTILFIHFFPCLLYGLEFKQ